MPNATQKFPSKSCLPSLQQWRIHVMPLPCLPVTGQQQYNATEACSARFFCPPSFFHFTMSTVLSQLAYVKASALGKGMLLPPVKMAHTTMRRSHVQTTKCHIVSHALVSSPMPPPSSPAHAYAHTHSTTSTLSTSVPKCPCVPHTAHTVTCHPPSPSSQRYETHVDELPCSSLLCLSCHVSNGTEGSGSSM